MIIDQFNIFFDNAAAAASATGNVVELMPLMGRNEPVNVTFIAKGDEVNTFSLKLEESKDGATFGTVATFGFTKGAAPAAFTLALPKSLEGEYVRLSYTATGTVSGTKIFAGITRDHFAPYTTGQFIDAGRVVA